MTYDRRPATRSPTPDPKCAAPSSVHAPPPPPGSGAGAVVAAILLQGVLAASDRLGDAAAQLDELADRPRALRDA